MVSRTEKIYSKALADPIILGIVNKAIRLEVNPAQAYEELTSYVLGDSLSLRESGRKGEIRDAIVSEVGFFTPGRSSQSLLERYVIKRRGDKIIDAAD